MHYSRAVSFVFGFTVLATAQQHQQQHQQCGQPTIKHKTLIYGGHKVEPGRWPWHASVTHRTVTTYEVVCGGSIIHQSTILTAAHCLYTEDGLITPERVVIHVGRTKLSAFNSHTRTYVADEFHIHPNHTHASVRDDIALIRLANVIEMSDFIQPVCLWPANERHDGLVGRSGVVVGFGLTDDERMSDSLLEAEVPVVSLWDCLDSNRKVFGPHLTSRMICAGELSGSVGRGPCNGDSGGGLFFLEDDAWYIRGIVSFTTKLYNSRKCDPHQYAVYTDVSQYIDWIKPLLVQRSTAAASTFGTDIEGKHTYGSEDDLDHLFDVYLTAD